MRILHVLDHSLPVQSGYSFRAQAILREQRRLGWETVQITSAKQESVRDGVESVDGFDFHRTAAGKRLGRLPVLSQVDVVTRLRRRLRPLVASSRPDVVHAHSPCLTALAAAGLGVPLVYEMRSSWEDAAVSSGITHEGSLRYRLSRALETRALRRADAVTTICEGLRQEILHRGIAADRLAVIPNAVDPEAFTVDAPPNAALRTALGLDGCFVIGFVGSFFAWEGLTLLLEAVPRIVSARPDARVLLVGGGPDEPAIRAAIGRLGLSNFVVLAGRLPHDQIRAAYDAVDLLAYPRVPIRLTEMVTPLKPLEAMALGKAFVASDVGGHRELVRNEVTGVLFKAGDAAALAGAVLRLAEHPQMRESLRAAGRRFIETERTWARVVSGYEPIYRSVMERSRHAPRRGRI